MYNTQNNNNKLTNQNIISRITWHDEFFFSLLFVCLFVLFALPISLFFIFFLLTDGMKNNPPKKRLTARYTDRVKRVVSMLLLSVFCTSACLLFHNPSNKYQIYHSVQYSVLCGWSRSVCRWEDKETERKGLVRCSIPLCIDIRRWEGWHECECGGARSVTLDDDDDRMPWYENFHMSYGCTQITMTTTTTCCCGRQQRTGRSLREILPSHQHCASLSLSQFLVFSQFPKFYHAHQERKAREREREGRKSRWPIYLPTRGVVRGEGPH